MRARSQPSCHMRSLHGPSSWTLKVCDLLQRAAWRASTLSLKAVGCSEQVPNLAERLQNAPFDDGIGNRPPEDEDTECPAAFAQGSLLRPTTRPRSPTNRNPTTGTPSRTGLAGTTSGIGDNVTTGAPLRAGQHADHCRQGYQPGHYRQRQGQTTTAEGIYGQKDQGYQNSNQLAFRFERTRAVWG